MCARLMLGGLAVLCVGASLVIVGAPERRAEGATPATTAPTAATEPVDEPPVRRKRPIQVVEPEAGVIAEATDEALSEEDVESQTPPRPEPRRRSQRPYGSAGDDPPGWVQNGPNATVAPNASAEVVAAFEHASCVSATRCPGGEPIAVDTAEKRADFLRGLIDDRVTQVLLTVAERHSILVNSARSSHSRYVQDRSGRQLDSNHYYGRAADIAAVDGVPCTQETADRPYRGGLNNAPPSSPGPCTRLAEEINELMPGDLLPTEIIYYFDVGPPSGVSLENHDDHVHIGFNTF